MKQSLSNRICGSLFVLTLCLSIWLLYSWPSLAQAPSEAHHARWLNQETPSTDSHDLTVADLPTALQYTMSETMGAEEASSPLIVDQFIQQAKLAASDGEAQSYFGRAVVIDDDIIVVGSPLADNRKGAVYIFERPKDGWDTVITETAKLIASDGEGGVFPNGGYFGRSITIDNDTVVIGADGDNDNTGAVYIYEKPLGGWASTITETVKLTVSNGKMNDRFGSAVAIENETIIIGAYGDNSNTGAAYIYEKPVGGWASTITETAKLIAFDSDTNDRFGSSVAFTGDTVIIGAIFHKDQGPADGAAYIFEKPSGGWASVITETAKLTASDGQTKDLFGRAVAINGNTGVIGTSPSDDTGWAYIYEKPESGWVTTSNFTAKLTANDSAKYDYFGRAVDIDNNTVIIGASGNDDNDKSENIGSAYIYEKPDSGWVTTSNFTTKLIAEAGADDNYFGVSVAIDDEDLIIGATGYDDFKGVAYIFADVASSEIMLRGNGVEIATGDTTPTNHTDFGSTATDSGSVQRTFTIANTGDGDLIVSDVTLTGLHSSDFTVIEQPASTVAAKSSTSFTIQFTPSAVGVRTAQVSLTNNDPDESPYIFAIQGTGTAAKSSVYLPLLSKP